jgi:hypothetical protein
LQHGGADVLDEAGFPGGEIQGVVVEQGVASGCEGVAGGGDRAVT